MSLANIPNKKKIEWRTLICQRQLECFSLTGGGGGANESSPLFFENKKGFRRCTTENPGKLLQPLHLPTLSYKPQTTRRLKGAGLESVLNIAEWTCAVCGGLSISIQTYWLIKWFSMQKPKISLYLFEWKEYPYPNPIEAKEEATHGNNQVKLTWDQYCVNCSNIYTARA